MQEASRKRYAYLPLPPQLRLLRGNRSEYIQRPRQAPRNIVAVATLSDVSCIVLCEGVTLDETVKNTAEAKGINIFATDMTAYEAAKKLAELGL